MTDELFVIWSFEHDAWWAPAEWGYTEKLAEAGRYSAADTKRILAKANLIRVNEQAVPEREAATFRPARLR